MDELTAIRQELFETRADLERFERVASRRKKPRITGKEMLAMDDDAFSALCRSLSRRDPDTMLEVFGI